LIKRPSSREIFSFIKNKDFLSTSLNYGWSLVSGPVTLIFIPLFLTKELQGYYYAFTSISALSILADLGFSNIILQFAAHEFAFLSFRDNKISFDDPSKEIHLKKLASLFRFSVKWVSIIILIAFPIIFIIGYLLFKHNNDNINWIVPWIIFSVGSAITFFNTVLLAFFEGCDMVAKIQRIRFYNILVFSIVVLSFLALRFNLYSLAFASLISSLFTGLILIKNFRFLISQMLKYSIVNVYNWKKEILNLFWKYAISFSSVYFTFQIYTPLAFRFYGAEEAGRIGFSIAIWGAILLLANIWIASVLPKINILVANRNWKELDRLFLRRFLAGEMTLIFAGISFFIIYFVAARFFPITERLTSITNLAIMFIIWAIQFLIKTMAIYLRAHKEDPFYVILFFSSAYIAIVTYLSARFLSSDFIFIGFISACILFLPWYLSIFRKRRQNWHGLSD